MVSIWETEELARYLCGIDDGDEKTDIDEALMEKFEIDFCQFAKLATALLPLCVVHKSRLTGRTYQGFGANSVMLFQQEIPPPTGD